MHASEQFPNCNAYVQSSNGLKSSRGDKLLSLSLLDLSAASRKEKPNSGLSLDLAITSDASPLIHDVRKQTVTGHRLNK